MGVARRLALGRLISLSGGSAAYIALVAAIYGRTGSALWVSAAIFSSVVASVLSAGAGRRVGGPPHPRGAPIGGGPAAAPPSPGTGPARGPRAPPLRPACRPDRVRPGCGRRLAGHGRDRRPGRTRRPPRARLGRSEPVRAGIRGGDPEPRRARRAAAGERARRGDLVGRLPHGPAARRARARRGRVGGRALRRRRRDPRLLGAYRRFDSPAARKPRERGGPLRRGR